MLANDYQAEADRTRAQYIDETEAAVVGALGLSGETGETVDLIKKMIFHGHDVAQEKVKEELGDILWYIAHMCTTFSMTLAEVMEYNVQKLHSRYPKGFSHEASRDR